MYILIREGKVSKAELDGNYTLDEFLKLYALWRMSEDIQAIRADEMNKKSRS